MAEIILVILLLLFYFLIACFCIASYIVNALGLYRAAKASGINNSWLAWIPVANIWVLGSVTDVIDTNYGLKRRWSKALLGTYIGVFVTIIPAYITMFAFIIMTSLSGASNEFATATMIMFFIFYVFIIIAAMVSVVNQAISFVCLYKIFEKTVPEKSLKYLILSILVPFATGICLMKCYPQTTGPVSKISSEI